MNCPHCDAEIAFDNVNALYEALDCPTYFPTACEHCGEDIDVQVGARPAFTFNIPLVRLPPVRLPPRDTRGAPRYRPQEGSQ